MARTSPRYGEQNLTDEDFESYGGSSSSGYDSSGSEPLHSPRDLFGIVCFIAIVIAVVLGL